MIMDECKEHGRITVLCAICLEEIIRKHCMCPIHGNGLLYCNLCER